MEKAGRGATSPIVVMMMVVVVMMVTPNAPMMVMMVMVLDFLNDVALGNGRCDIQGGEFGWRVRDGRKQFGESVHFQCIDGV